MKRLLVLFAILAMTVCAAHAQSTSGSASQDQIFWDQQIDASQPWGIWLKEVYKPYSDRLSGAILKIISSAAEVDPTGKSNKEILEEVNAALNRSLKSMELIKPPVELKVYHSKVIELYRETINSEPQDKSKTAIVIKRLTKEADQAITKAFRSHGIPQNVIDNFTRE